VLAPHLGGEIGAMMLGDYNRLARWTRSKKAFAANK
jgi:hypothetical protein